MISHRSVPSNNEVLIKVHVNAMIDNANQADYPLLLMYGDNDVIVDRTFHKQ